MTFPQTVVVVQSGDYEQRGIDLIAIDRETAIAELKQRYDEPPYVIEWRYLADENALLGDFEAVAGYSTKHVARFDFTDMPIVGNA